MDEKQILRSISDTIVSKSVTIEVDIIKKSWLDRVTRRGKKVFEITPITLGSLTKISKELIDLDLKDFDSANMLESNYKLILNNSEKLAKVVAYAVVNSRAEPPKSLVNFFLDNLTPGELFKIASIVLKSMDLQNFMLSILSLKGTNVLSEKSLQAEETIASGKQSAA